MLAGAPLLAATACHGGSRGGGHAAAPSARVTITPGDGTTAARPDKGIAVTVTGGTLRSVTVQTDGHRVSGTMNAAQTRWTSQWALRPSARYTVRATAVNAAGRTTTATSTFTTLQPRHTIHVVVTPNPGETVGVGMPIIVSFDQPVTDKAEVERAFEVLAQKPTQGAWRWFGDREAVFRTRTYWPDDQRVTFLAHLSGVQAAPDVYGVSDVAVQFEIGNAQVTTVDTRTHEATVEVDGEIVRRMPISAGRATSRATTTTDGIHLAMEKDYHVVMDSATIGIPKGSPGYYRLDVYYAVRISNSGEYVHSAPWSVASQGRVNVSHGCVNVSPANAVWFFHFSHRGDIIKVTGTHRRLEYDNGWGFWQMPWREWVKGSALQQPVELTQAFTPPGTPGVTATTPSGSPGPTATASGTVASATPSPSAR